MKKLKIAIPKGRINEKIIKLLSEIDIQLLTNGRNYKPKASDSEIEIKLLKPQNIPKIVESGSQDIGFTGYDWIIEQEAKIEELLDLGFNPVKIIAAVPDNFDQSLLKTSRIRIVSEYENISKTFLEKQGIDYRFIRAYGATEVFPPEDADMIIDNTSTGTTLNDNGLKIIEKIMSSSTRMIGNKESMKDEWKRNKINQIIMLIKSVLAARKKVLIDMNAPADKIDYLINVLPCMRSPTVSELYGKKGFAIRIAVNKDEVNNLLPILKQNKVTDILISRIEKIVM